MGGLMCMDGMDGWMDCMHGYMDRYIYSIKRFGSTARFGAPTPPRPPASEISPKFWASCGTTRTADTVSLNFGEILGAG